MDERTLRFLVFLVFSAACVAAGWGLRRRHAAAESWSPHVHLHSVIWFWSPVVLISFWRLPIDAGLARFMLMQPLIMIAAWWITEACSRLLRVDRQRTGVLILAAVLSNQGFTLGAYLCYALLDPPAEALGYGMAFVMAMQLTMVLVFYPVAAHHGPERHPSILSLMVRSLFTVRAMPLAAIGVGATLSRLDVATPSWIEGSAVMDALFYLGGGSAYFGIGLRLRFMDALRDPGLHVGVALIQFALQPLLALGALYGLSAFGWPATSLQNEVAFIEAFSPVAINTVIVANLFRLDARLAAALWLSNTVLFCLLPLPALLWHYG